MLWVDKYRPKRLDRMEFHARVNEQLRTLAAARDFPHLLFYGPPGAGKRTRVLGFLADVYGAGAGRVQSEMRDFTLPNRKVVQLGVVSSAFHVELNPGDAGIHDRLVVQLVIKEMAQSPPLEMCEGATHGGFRVIVLHDVDRMSRDAQQALRRTMEKYSAVCRLILVCNSTSKVIDPIRSRCLNVRVPAPAVDEISAVLQAVAASEQFKLPDRLAANIAELSGRNARRALLSLEATKVQAYPFHERTVAQRIDWELYIVATARKLVAECSPRALLEIRQRFYELIAHCIPADLVLQTLCSELLPLIDASLRPAMLFWAAHYEARLHLASQPVYHLEAFAAKAMQLQQQFILQFQQM